MSNDTSGKKISKAINKIDNFFNLKDFIKIIYNKLQQQNHKLNKKLI